MRGFRHLPGLAVIATLLAAGLAAAAPYDDLLQRVPEQANSILFANVRALYNSALGRELNWHRKLESDYVGGLTNLPPQADRAVMAQRMDPTTLQAAWRIELVQLNMPITAADLARRVSGTMDQVGGFNVVASPRGSFFVEFSPRLFAEAYPADRQKLSRWLQFCQKNTRPVVSPYLLDSAADAGEGAQALLAIDLKDVFDMPGITQRLANAESLKGKRGVDLRALAELLAGIQGMQIRVRVDRVIHGEIRLDFSSSAEPMHVVAKDFIIDAMESMGAAVEDLNSPNWRARIEGNRVILAGDLSPRGARLLLSPGANRITGTAYADLTRTEAAPPDPKAAATMHYYRALTSLLDELNTTKDTRKISARGYWYQQYASKIDSLPLLNVDEEMLQFGTAVSQALRTMALVGSQAKAENDSVQSQVYYAPVSGWGSTSGYGWSYTGRVSGVATNYGAAVALCQQNARTEKAYREGTWANINAAKLAIRKKMVAKYNIEF